MLISEITIDPHNEVVDAIRDHTSQKVYALYRKLQTDSEYFTVPAFKLLPRDSIYEIVTELTYTVNNTRGLFPEGSQFTKMVNELLLYLDN